MFGDPLANVSLSGAAQTMPRVASGTDKAGNPFAVYQTSDGSLTVTIRQVTRREAGVDRKVARVLFDRKFTAPDPYNAEAGNKDFHLKSEIYIDKPNVVVTQTNYVDQVVMMTSFLTASTNAAIIKMFGGES